jgi:hypothetical protein
MARQASVGRYLAVELGSMSSREVHANVRIWDRVMLLQTGRFWPLPVCVFLEGLGRLRDSRILQRRLWAVFTPPTDPQDLQ